MSGAHPGMSGVHAVEHVHDLPAAHLTDNDTIRTHTQAAANEVCHRHAPLACRIAAAAFHMDDIFDLPHLELHTILNDNHTLLPGDRLRKRIQ